MSYSPVIITNATSFPVIHGKVEYMSVFCSSDDFSIAAGPSSYWKAASRGVCLLTKITATVKTDLASTEVKYKSSGTAHSHFAIIQKTDPSTGKSTFQIYALNDGMSDSVPADYVEPTTAQK